MNPFEPSGPHGSRTTPFRLFRRELTVGEDAGVGGVFEKKLGLSSSPDERRVTCGPRRGSSGVARILLIFSVRERRGRCTSAAKASCSCTSVASGRNCSLGSNVSLPRREPRRSFGGAESHGISKAPEPRR